MRACDQGDRVLEEGARVDAFGIVFVGKVVLSQRTGWTKLKRFALAGRRGASGPFGLGGGLQRHASFGRSDEVVVDTVRPEADMPFLGEQLLTAAPSASASAPRRPSHEEGGVGASAAASAGGGAARAALAGGAKAGGAEEVSKLSARCAGRTYLLSLVRAQNPDPNPNPTHPEPKPTPKPNPNPHPHLPAEPGAHALRRAPRSLCCTPLTRADARAPSRESSRGSTRRPSSQSCPSLSSSRRSGATC